jgi:hypothetical protein
LIFRLSLSDWEEEKEFFLLFRSEPAELNQEGKAKAYEFHNRH